MVQSESEADLMRVESLVVGNPAADVISESETPRHLVFEATDGHDFHVRTQVTLKNPQDEEHRDRVTVTLSEGDSTHGQTLASSSQTVSMGAGHVRTVDFNTAEFRLSSSTYQIEVETAGLSGIPFEVIATREYTKPASYTWDITPRGDYELVSHTGRPSIRVDGQSGEVAFPSGREVSTAPQQIGEDPNRVYRETAAPDDPAAIQDSNAPTTLTFQAGDGVDAHVQTRVTVENPTDSGKSEDITVQLLRRGTGGEADEVVASNSRNLSVFGGTTVTKVFFDDLIPLDDGEYAITAEFENATDLEIIETEEETRGGEYTWQQTSAGSLELVDHAGEVFTRYPLERGAVEFPGGLRMLDQTYQTHRGDPTKYELDRGDVMTYISDGSGTGKAGDLVYAINDSGTVKTFVIAAKANAT